MVRVAAAVIRKNELVLIAKRGPGRSMAGLWEFPGGKFEGNENPTECLVRELDEELAMKVRIGEKISTSAHGGIELTAYWAELIDDKFELREHSEIKWVRTSELLQHELAPADIPIARDIAFPPLIPLIERLDLVPTIVGWMKGAWPNSQHLEERLCGDKDRNKLPTALVAFSGKTPIGFVSILFHEKSSLTGRPHWIDAVYVEPSHRHGGIASHLVKSAEKRAASFGIQTLHVLTEIPKLYEKLGWAIVEVKNYDFILSKRVG